MKTTSSLVPILLFVYKRLEHTRKTLEALAANDLASESDLFIFSDGAKSDEVIPLVEQVREYIDNIKGFNSVTIVKRERNLGLANSIIDGVTQVVNRYGKIIVLEDDLITSPYFLKYMNDALNLYENEEQVASVNAYMYPIEGLPETFFLRAADCWGWGTWQRAWKLFNPDGTELLTKIIENALVDVFNFYGSYLYLDMLKDQIAGKNDSWAIRWSASVLINNKYGLYFGKSMTKNIGLDGTGRHCGNAADYNSEDLIQNRYEKIVYKEPSCGPQDYALMCDYFKRNFSKRLFRRISDFFFRSIKNFF